MRKIWVIACREYNSAVRSKAFVVTMVLMPVLMGGSVGIQALFKKLEDTKEKKYAVIDRSGGKLAIALEAGAVTYNQTEAIDPKTNEPRTSKIVLEIVPPSEDSPEAIAKQRFELSQRAERDEIEAIIEIGPKVYEQRADPAPDKAEDSEIVRFQTKKPTQQRIMRWAEQEINKAIIAQRVLEMKIDPKLLPNLLQIAPARSKTLTKQVADGAYVDSTEGAQVANFILPVVLIALMFMVIMVGATPAMQGIVEEKGLRIAEVLLGSATPFQLMAGKLLGVIGVSLTMAAVYLAGAYFMADRFGVSDLLSPTLLAWFLLFLVLALLIFGSLFIAIGAAAGDIKDTQTLMMPVMVIACLPFFALGPIMQDPNGKIAVVMSFFPFAAPMLLVARESVPPGVPLWQMVTGIAVVLATTLLCVWAAGRIFRVGILMQGKGARVADLFRWAWKG